MDGKTIFNMALETITKEHNLRVEYPYGDTYFELYDGDKLLGGMNPSGFKWLYNLGRLYDICKPLFR